VKVKSTPEAAMQPDKRGTSAKHVLCHESTAMKMLGLTRTKFRQLGLEPAKIIANPHHGSGLDSHFYDWLDVANLKGSPAVMELRAMQRKPFDYASRFTKKYGRQKNAVMDVARVTLNLNKYCSQKSCAEKERTEISELEKGVIRKLYSLGFCDKAFVHVKELPGKVCRECEGSGESHCGRLCLHCSGSGMYTYPRTLKFYVFHFVIESEQFVCYRPFEEVDFAVNIDNSNGPSVLTVTETKPLEIPRRKLTEVKALVRWFLSEAESGPCPITS
jgi:hypothetical protein